MNLASLKEKKGPFPLWVWALIAAVLIFGLYYFFRKRQSSSGSITSSNAPADASTGSIGTGYDTGSGSGGAGLGLPNDAIPPDGSVPYYVGSGMGDVTGSNLAAPVSANPTTDTSGIASSSSPVKPLGASKGATVTYVQTGSSLGATNAPPSAIAAASKSALRAAQKKGESPALAALAARSGGLNSAYGLGGAAPRNGTYFTYKKDAVKAAGGKGTVKFATGKGYYVG